VSAWTQGRFPRSIKHFLKSCWIPKKSLLFNGPANQMATTSPGEPIYVNYSGAFFPDSASGWGHVPPWFYSSSNDNLAS
jgi:hypothetical protein